MRIAVTSQILDGTGYGEYARLVAWGLHVAEHTLRTRNYRFSPERPERLGHKGDLVFERLGYEKETPVDLSLVIYIPTSFRVLVMEDVPNVGLSMTESDLVTDDYIRGVQECGMEVLGVPSEWNRKGFHACGLTVPTTVIHPPVDPDLLRMNVRRRRAAVDFLSIFNWPAPHKNPKALLEAFCRAFSHTDPVSLTIKTAGVTDEQIADDVHEAIRRSGRNRVPRIKVLCGSMSRQEILKLYANADVYVSSHHGEGWGLPIFESMAIGMPAIATAFSAPLEFMTLDNSFPVQYRYNEKYGNADVDIDDLAANMRRVFDHPDEARARGDKARVDLCARFTPEHTAKQVLEAARMAAEVRSMTAEVGT